MRLLLDRLKQKAGQVEIRAAWGLLAASLALAGCVVSPGGERTPYQPAPGSYQAPLPRQSTQLAPAPLPAQPQAAALDLAPTGTSVALLAPLSGPNADRGPSLVQAAKLALDAPGAPTLLVIDTTGTPDGAALAARQAIAQGAGLIIGPLTTAETAAAAPVAIDAGVGMLAFTSDEAQIKPGIWVMGLTAGQQVRRLVGAVTAQGKTRFAALLPATDYGRAMEQALRAAAPGASIRAVEDTNIQSANATVRDLSDYANRRGPIEARLRAAINLHTAEGRKQAAELRKAPIPHAPFDALLLASTGDGLDTIASLLPYYDIDAPGVRVLGPALWANPAARGTGNLNGAWYAAPDPALRMPFNQAYSARYGSPAPGLADLAFDAASIARVTAADGGFTSASLTRAGGFAGVDGVIGLQPDGHVRRGLALFELQRGGPQMIEPAPETLAAPGT